MPQIQGRTKEQMRVPVLDAEMRPLMPTTPTRARLLLKEGRASAYRNKLGIFCIILHEDKKANNQHLALGIDPGSKFEGWSVVGTRDTVLNGMSEAVTWVKDSMETRRNLRNARRYRKCPRRECRSDNRFKKGLPPSTKSRWQAKLNITKELCRVMPIETVVVEDVKAPYKTNSKKWNTNFSPLHHGKDWFYSQIRNHGLHLVMKTGHETKDFREYYCLSKCKEKEKAVFASHAVDAWCLAANETGAASPSWIGLFYWSRVRQHKRQLMALQPSKGRERRPYGGTRSLGLTRGTLVNHLKYGLTYIGGTLNTRVSLHRLSDGKRLTQNAKVEDLKILTTIHWRTRFLPSLTSRASTAYE